MPWIRVDDHYDEHPKFARVGPLGVAVWLAGLAYCNRNLTDGFIPWAAARKLVSWEFLRGDGQTDRELIWTISVSTGMHGEDVECPMVVDMLVDAGLWAECDGGYSVHDYGLYQPTRAVIEADRAAKVAAGAAGGRASAIARAVRGAEASATAGAQAESKPVPKPKPVPSRDTPPPPTSGGRRSDGTNPRANGHAPREEGTNPRTLGTSPRQERTAQKRGPSALHEILTAIQRGEAD